jgi:Fe-S-cluster-containing dehydrogenase component
MAGGSHGAFVLDLDRCTGCAACVVACNNENPVAAESNWRGVYTFNHQRLATQPVFHLSLACNHCFDPACQANCPADAYVIEPESGAVLIHRERCMGCRYCSWVCPYDAPRFDPVSGLMEKCTFCHERLQQGRRPACVSACPTDALDFERINTPVANHQPGFPDTGLRPAVRFEGSRHETAPAMTAAPVAFNFPARPSSIDWSGLRNEWSLLFFSWVAAMLVAWFTASAADFTRVSLPVFSVAGLLAMGISTLHLGRISRAWRAPLNLRRSWVSREVVLFSSFFAAACVSLMGARTVFWPQQAIACIGFASMFAMDMVYRAPDQPVHTVPHSAMATLTAALYVGILAGNPAILWPVVVLKLVLYLARNKRPRPGGNALAPIRIGVGLFPAIALAATGLIPAPVAMLGAAIGEFIDRAEFYANLRFLTPAHQIDRDLARSAA